MVVFVVLEGCVVFVVCGVFVCGVVWVFLVVFGGVFVCVEN
jgi:hypothetical protein